MGNFSFPSLFYILWCLLILKFADLSFFTHSYLWAFDPSLSAAVHISAFPSGFSCFAIFVSREKIFRGLLVPAASPMTWSLMVALHLLGRQNEKKKMKLASLVVKCFGHWRLEFFAYT